MTRKTSPRLITLILMTAATTLSLNMFLPSLPAIAAEFGVAYGTVTLAIGGYLAMTAVLALVIGPLSDRLGRRPVAIGAIAVFVLASLGCLLAQSWPLFLACRLAQGTMVSGYILAGAVVRDTRDQTDAASLLGYIAGAMAIAPLLGPMVGGLMLDLFGWRSNFALYAGLGLILLAAVLIDLAETKSPPVTKPPRSGALLRLPVFWSYAGTVALSTCAFYAFLAGAPLVAAKTYGLSGAELGIALGSITAGFMTGSFTGARLGPRYGPDRMMLSGRLIAILGLAAGLVIVQIWPSAPLALFATTIFIGLGNGLTTPTANAGAMSVRPDLAGTASGVTGSLTVGLGAVATTGAGLILTLSPSATTLLTILIALKSASLVTAILAWRGSPISSR
ncbi:multidrug effflux MFS transporter [Aestuariivita sp.]|jgi:MFS family permease|uniref:multidrug effflux MFS transporter n=1 Tax=Aestuariivita sp. TaxID=1872407 RepID=UPI00217115F9|nr:multidrug effflux MFS transporter [Aestuariivita sp.]MCE8006280.1 multidrug effflux MFS transporter [Aestuariivita sp.]